MSVPRLRTGILRRVPETLVSFGVDPGPLLARAGLDPDPERWCDCIALSQALKLIDLGARATGEHEFGARAGVRTTVELGQIAAILMRENPLGRALRLAASRAHEIREGVAHELHFVAGGKVEFRELLPGPRERDEQICLVDASLAAVLAILRARIGRAFTPDLVRLPPGRGRSARRLSDILRAPVAFEPKRPAALVFPAALLGTFVPVDAAIRLPEAVPLYASPKADPDVPSACRHLAAGMLALGELPSLHEATRTLGMPGRTIQSRLEREGLSFHDLRDDAVRNRAVALLVEHGVSVTEAALSLGYSDPANFTRAFRKWFGVPPSRFRDARAGGPEPGRRPQGGRG